VSRWHPILATLRYVKARASERSTWLFLSASVSAAALLPAPWSYVVAAIGAVAAMLPEPKDEG
jgi:hypothetical protein